MLICLDFSSRDVCLTKILQTSLVLQYLSIVNYMDFHIAHATSSLMGLGTTSNRLCPKLGPHFILGRESTQSGKVPCPGIQRHSTTFSPAGYSDLRSLAFRSRMLPLRHDARLKVAHA